MFLFRLWKITQGYSEQCNVQYVQFGSACWCVRIGEKIAKIFILHLVTDICYNKRFIMRVRCVLFRIPWRNLAERSFLLGMTMKCLERVTYHIQSARNWLQTFHGPWRTTLAYLYLCLIQVDIVTWIQSVYVEHDCIEQDLPTHPRKQQVWWHKIHGKSSWERG